MDWKIASWVGLGSAVDGITRYAVSELLTKGAFPLGTLAVNVLGSFLLGLLLASEPRSVWITPTGTAALGVGLLGGFTTMAPSASRRSRSATTASSVWPRSTWL